MKQTKNKPFKLPSKFAQKWLIALRSGEYDQIEGQLIDCSIHFGESGEIEIKRSNIKKGCCLGVAAVMCGATDEDLRNYGMPFEVDVKVWDRINYPKELQESKRKSLTLTPLSIVLANLNDGLTLSFADDTKKEYPNIIFHKLPERYFYDEDEDDGPVFEHYSFEDIAKFIEDNVEFYEEDEGV